MTTPEIVLWQYEYYASESLNEPCLPLAFICSVVMCGTPQTGKFKRVMLAIHQLAANKHTAQSPIKDTMGTHNQEVGMKIRDLSKQIAGFILGFTILLCVGFGSSVASNAQDRSSDQSRRDRNWDRYGNYGGSAELRQTALTAGYNEGFRVGNEDRQNRRRPNYQNSNAYRRATQNYNSRLGDRKLYQRYFREAFENGYNFNGDNQGNFGRNDGSRYPDRNNSNNRTRRGRNWDGYGNFGGSADLRQIALNAGYNEGEKQGQKDRNRNTNSSFQGQSAYQKATKDYSSRLGSRDVYQRYFREAYESGYSDGMNGY